MRRAMSRYSPKAIWCIAIIHCRRESLTSPHYPWGNSDLKRRAMQGEIQRDRRRRSSNLTNEEATTLT
ncbi:hypothetical protein SLA2020_031910 [Shorea laevis]